MMLLGAAAAPWALAATEWQPYASVPPLYLEGEVTTIIWADPSPYLELLHREGAVIPADLTAREIAPHKDLQRVRNLLKRAALPFSEDRRWRVQLPSMPRLQAAGMQRPKIGEVVGVVGFAGPPVSAVQVLQAEVVFTGARGYPLRSERR
jgi:hypothetical protein